MSFKKPFGRTWKEWFWQLIRDTQRQRYYKKHRCNHYWIWQHNDELFKKHIYKCKKCYQYKSEYY